MRLLAIRVFGVCGLIALYFVHPIVGFAALAASGFGYVLWERHVAAGA